MTTRALIGLLRPTVATVPWGPLAAAVTVGLAIITVPVTVTSRLDPSHLADLVRMSAVCGALGGSFLLDDPAARTVVALPVSRLFRQAMRVVVALPVLAVAWAMTLAIAGFRDDKGALPVGGLTVEATALFAAALAVAAIRLRDDAHGSAGPLAALCVLAATTVAAFLPAPIGLFPAPQDPEWNRIHWWWAAILATAIGAQVWAGWRRFRR